MKKIVFLEWHLSEKWLRELFSQIQLKIVAIEQVVVLSTML